MADDDWGNDRRQITYEEARTVINAQNDTMTDIDNKAMRTVRLTIVIIGLLISAVQFAPGTFDERLMGYGVGILATSGIVGIITYNESNLFVGPDGEYVEQLATNDFDDGEWDHDLLIAFAGMI